MNSTHLYREQRGAAILVALGVLIVLSLLGTSWVVYMSLESTDTRQDLYVARAAAAAQGGARAAIAQMQQALRDRRAAELTASPLVIDIPVYRADAKTAIDAAPVLDDRYHAGVSAVITDECAKVNVNFAPPNVLISLLGIDGDKARSIRANLPRLDGSGAPGGGDPKNWLTSVDELIARNLLTADVLTTERAAQLTVYTVPDPSNPEGFININSASEDVLRAVLDVTPDAAARVAAARPLSSAAELAAVAGKVASTFNYPPPPDDPGALPREFSFSSRCYRIVCSAGLDRIDLDNPQRRASAGVETVVYFPEDGKPRILYWNEWARLGG
ncbi:MAG: hypothetical protein AMXMBFR4_03390 [Candidatus Hydrogenedentota bacterium]